MAISGDCLPPYIPKVGEASFDMQADDSGRYPMQTAMFLSCPSNHRREGPNFRLCQPDGSWDGADIYCINLVTCEDPGSPGDLIREGKCCRHGAKLKYSCPPDLYLNGASAIWCEKTGNWSDEVPTCQRRVVCPNPGEIENGFRYVERAHSGKDLLSGDKITYRCSYRYELEDGQSKHDITCQGDGTWNDTIPTCTEIPTCDHPGIPLDGQRFGVCCQRDNLLSFRCNENFTLIGSRSIKCLQNGHWDYPIPKCERRVVCLDPGEIEHGYRDTGERTHSGLDFRPGDKIKYYCSFTHELGDGQSKHEILCQGDETWNDTLPTCTEIPTCSDPGIPVNGKRYGSYWQRGEVVHFLCNEQFSRIGPRSIECLYNRQWNDSMPTCERKRVCSDPGNIENGSRTENKTSMVDGYGVGDRILFTCNIGYHMTGFHDNHELICQDNGQWKNSLLPSCTEGNQRRCQDPGEIPNGMRTINKSVEIDGFAPGDSVRYTCQSGYQFYTAFDSYTLTCQEEEAWDLRTPKCIQSGITRCQDPGELIHGYALKHLSGNGVEFLPGDTIKYACNRGFFLLFFFEDSMTIKCGVDGGWDDDIPECEEIVCDLPTPPVHGYIQPANQTEFHADESIHFSCMEGYELTGPGTRTCNHYERGWTAWNPECKAILCPDPGWPPNGRRIGNGFSVGETVQFVCESGFQLLGSQSRTCLPTKQWNGSLTICDTLGADCSDPGTPIGGTRTGKQFDLGDTVQYSCQDGFYLVGSAERKCIPNRMWSGMPAHCESEDSFVDLAKARSQIARHVDVLATETISSDIGERLSRETTRQLGAMGGLNLFFVFDVSGSIDQSQFSSAKNFSSILVDKLGVSEEGTQIAALSFDTEVQSAFNIGDPGTDTPEAVKELIHKIKHTGHGTALTRAFTYIYDEMLPNATRHSRHSIKNALFLITDGKHNMGGSPLPIADQLKKPPYNMEIFCIGLGSNIDKFTLHRIASSPDKFWALMSNEDLQAVTEFIVSNEENYETCGVGGMQNPSRNTTIFSGFRVEDITEWPWLSAVYYNIYESDIKEEYELKCGASLIDKSWVLTAASCLYGLSNNVTRLDVRIGATTNQDSIIMEISEIYLHPNFDYSSMENNIALLKLRHPAVLTPMIRKVCLPQNIKSETDRNWYKRGTWNTLVAWPQTVCARGECDKPILQQSLVLTRSRNRCSRWSHCSKNMPDTTFCATIRGIGMDVTKSGYPLLVEAKEDDLETASKKIYQIGILSLKKRCKFYTKVTAFLPWIYRTMESDDVLDQGRVS